jgi:holo-[acyl-carrier protein] synthase
MIYGIGVDIVRIDRIAGVMARTDGRFAARVLGMGELEKYQARARACTARGLAFLASRFAAKEAFAKATGLGMHWPMTWRALQTLNQRNGQPFITAEGPLANWLSARRIRTHIMLSDERELALAFVIAEQDWNGIASHSAANEADRFGI